jgi:hypothetical protein
VLRVPVEMVPAALDLVEASLAKVVRATDNESCRAVGTRLVQGIDHLWLLGSAGKILASVVTRIEQREGYRALTAPYMAGKEFDAWKGVFHDAALAFAKENQCRKMEIVGREGVARRLRELGWSKFAVIFQCEVG